MVLRKMLCKRYFSRDYYFFADFNKNQKQRHSSTSFIKGTHFWQFQVDSFSGTEAVAWSIFSRENWPLSKSCKFVGYLLNLRAILILKAIF